jgi:membrane protease YdiL (CAAX protease family)
VVLRVRRPTLVALGAYVGALTAGEALNAFVGPVAAAGADGAILLVLLAHYVMGGATDGRVFAALGLLPLLRLSGLALATENHILFLVVSGTPVLLAGVLAARGLELPGALALFDIRKRSQWHVALAAALAAVIAAPFVHVMPVARPHSVLAWAVAGLVVFVFVGLLEELLFRGVIQGALDPMLGAWSIPVADLLFAAAYLDSGSPGFTAGMAVFGMACGWWVRRTRSLAGAAVAHGLVAVALLLLSGALQ